MADGKISEFLRMQRVLAEEKGWMKNRTPEGAPMSILWSIDELGEAIAIIKKKGGEAIMNNPSVRAHFTEECADVFMYLFDMFLAYGITAEEFTDAYVAKFQRNLGRDWHENNAMYESCAYEAVCFALTAPIPDQLTDALKKMGVTIAYTITDSIKNGKTVYCTDDCTKIDDGKKLGMTTVYLGGTPHPTADGTISTLDVLPDFLAKP